MAIGWLTLLQNVPWSDVIQNAPKVADGAKKLWDAVAGKTSSAEVSDLGNQSANLPESEKIVALERRVVELEDAVAGLHKQMLASSELIKALAEQNEQLVKGIESNRKRLKWLSVTMAAMVTAALLGLLLLNK